MRLVSNQVSHSFARKLEGCGVTVAEWVLLREMYDVEGSTSVVLLAESTGLSRGAVSKLTTRLLEKELVSRKESQSDRRFQHIELTQPSRKLVPQLAKIADQNDSSFFDCLDEKEKVRLKDTLQKLAEYHQIKSIPIE